MNTEGFSTPFSGQWNRI